MADINMQYKIISSQGYTSLVRHRYLRCIPGYMNAISELCYGLSC